VDGESRGVGVLRHLAMRLGEEPGGEGKVSNTAGSKEPRDRRHRKSTFPESTGGAGAGWSQPDGAVV